MHSYVTHDQKYIEVILCFQDSDSELVVPSIKILVLVVFTFLYLEFEEIFSRFWRLFL